MCSSDLVVFCFCLTSFGVVLVLGGVGRATLETEIYRLTTQELALDRAAVLVVVQLVAVALTVSCAGRFGRSATVVSQVGARTVRRPVRARSTRLAAGAVLGFAAVLVVAPAVGLVVVLIRILAARSPDLDVPAETAAAQPGSGRRPEGRELVGDP